MEYEHVRSTRSQPGEHHLDLLSFDCKQSWIRLLPGILLLDDFRGLEELCLFTFRGGRGDDGDGKLDGGHS